MNESRAGRYFNTNGFSGKDVRKFLPVGFNPNGLNNMFISNRRMPADVIRNPHQNLAQLVKGSMRHPNNVLGNFM